MAWFHPRTLLDKTYEIGILLKGINGAFELIGGLFLWLVPSRSIADITRFLTASQLQHNPQSAWAIHLEKVGSSVAAGNNTFAIIFLLTHGIVKVVLVVSLLRNKMWAFPFALATLGLFIAYQLYAMVVKPTFGMAALTILDLFIVWLIWREWKQARHLTPDTDTSSEEVSSV